MIKLLPFPKRLTIEFTNFCNLKCIMCHRSFNNKEIGFMDFMLLKKIMDEAYIYNVDVVPFFRGESLMHPKFIEFMKYIRIRTSGSIQLATNGYILTPEYCDQLIQLKLDFISISLDTLNQELYQKIRGEYFLDRILQNIEYLLANRDDKPEVQISAVETLLNKDLLPEFIDYWRKKVERVRIYPQDSADGRAGSLPEYYKRVFLHRLPCHKLYSEIVIYWDGNIAICNHDWHRPFSIGNVNEMSIREIWNGELYSSLRRSNENGIFSEKETCATCDYWVAPYLKEGYVGYLYQREKG